MKPESALLKWRNSIRVEVKWRILVETSERCLKANVTNIGEQGASLSFLLEDLAAKDTLDECARLKIHLEDEGTILPMVGKVVWKQRRGEIVSCGVEFENCPPSLRAYLQEMLFLRTENSSRPNQLVPSAKTAEDLLDSLNGTIKEATVGFLNIELPKFVRALIILDEKIAGSQEYQIVHERELVDLSEALLRKADELDKQLGQVSLKRKLRKAFRAATGNWAYKSALVRRGFEKPLGYPGDYRMLEQIYDNERISKGLGAYWDGYFLNDPYADAVRNRKDLMRAMISDFLSTTKAQDLRILNLASGSCREVRELQSEMNKTRSDLKIVFSCVDQDAQAIEFSRSAIGNHNGHYTITFIQENILKYARYPEKYLGNLSNQDLVYSIGLADYLPDKILQGLIRFSYLALRRGGKLVLAHKNCDAHNPLAPKWYCDWEFIPRNETYLIKLFKEAGITENCQIKHDPAGNIFFVTIEKNN